MDDCMEELILLRNELNAIGNNFNQLVRRVNAAQSDSEVTIAAASTLKNQELFLSKAEEIKGYISKFSEKWLQNFTAGNP